MVNTPYNTFNPIYTNNTINNVKHTINNVKEQISINKMPVFFVCFIIIAIICTIIYIYRYFKNKKKQEKKESVYPGYTLPCPDYWTDISGEEKTDGICHNPKQLGTCRKFTNIYYGDQLYLLNLTNKYITKHSNNIDKQPLTINTDLSYNPNISYLTVTDKISSCNELSATIVPNILSCYEKKNITNHLNYDKQGHGNHIITNVKGSLDDAKIICNQTNDKDSPSEWLEWKNPELSKTTITKERIKELEENRKNIKDKLFICGSSEQNTENCLEYYSDNNILPDKVYYKPHENDTYHWQKTHPKNLTIPSSMKCQGIKKYHDIYKLIYGKVNIPESVLQEGHSNDTVWVKSFCNNDEFKKTIINTLIPTEQSIWELENVSESNSTEAISYYDSTKTTIFNNIFYIKHVDTSTKNSNYLTICDNNSIHSESSSENIYISAPEKCQSQYRSVVSTKTKGTDDEYKWIFYKENKGPNIVDTQTTIQSGDNVYIASMYEYNTTKNQPKYILGTCGKHNTDKYLQLIEFKDRNTSDNIWSFIVKSSSENNPVIQDVNFNTLLGINIRENPTVANNKHNLKRKCEWAKSCDLTWDVVDKLC